MTKIIFYKILIIIGLIISMIACTEPIDLELDRSYTRLVVFGELSTDTSTHSIRLTRSADYFANKPSTGLSGAEVSLNDGESEIVLMENPENPGLYQTSSDYYGIPGKTYILNIEKVDADGDGEWESYSAASYLPPLPGIDSIRLQYARYPFFKGAEILLYARDSAETEDYYAFKVRRNGVMVTDTLPEIIIQNDLFFNGNYTNGVSVQYLDDEKPDEKLLPGDLVTFEMHGITKEYYNFIIEAQTELFGSNPLFSGPPANVSTNLTNGAVGFFAAVNIKRAWAFAPVVNESQ